MSVPHCGHHLPIGAYLRLSLLLDPFTFRELWPEMTAPNVLDFPGYEDKLNAQRQKTALPDAAVAATGKLDGYQAVFAVLDSRFFMASMGVAVGEKITRAVEYAQKHKLPLIIFSASGGARMQEGILSLMQMAKTSVLPLSAFPGGRVVHLGIYPSHHWRRYRQLCLSGGYHSGRAGSLDWICRPAVIRQTIGQELPEGFQRGGVFGGARFCGPDCSPASVAGDAVPAAGTSPKGGVPPMSEITAAQRVKLARAVARPGAMDYINALFTDVFECKGDRLHKEDPSIFGAIARFHGKPVTVLGIRKGRTFEQKMKYNFGMPSPEGYRKAQRLMRQAEKFKRPVITFVDTPGAYPGLEAEAEGQGEAIAASLALMSSLTVPVIAVVIGEAGSGGALALAVGNRVILLENAVYSVLSPEGFASILWKDAGGRTRRQR